MAIEIDEIDSQEKGPGIARRGIDALRHVGGAVVETALEVVDSSRTAHRLMGPHDSERLGEAADDLQSAKDCAERNLVEPAAVRTQTIHILRIFIASLDRALQREQASREEAILVIKSILCEHLPDEDMSTLGLSEAELNLLRRCL